MQKRLSIRLRTQGSILSLLLGLFLAVTVARGHALLVRSVPAAGAELAVAPATIELWFSEPLEPAFSTASLLDAQGNPVGSGTATVDGADPTHLTLPLTAVPPGIYTVLYHNLSQADGHEWVGSFPLTVLNPDGTRPTGAGADATAATANIQGNQLPPPLKILSRWLALLGAMSLVGMLAFPPITLGGWQAGKSETLPASGEERLIAALARMVRVGVVVSISAVFVGSWLQVLAQMVTLDGGGVRGGVALDLFFRTRTGTLLVSRQLLAGALLFVTIVTAGLPANGQRAGQWTALLLSCALLATFSLGSHAAAVAGSGWAIAGDFIHLVAAALWLGGLIALALLLWQWHQQPTVDLRLLYRIVRRFSLLATLAVFVLVVTGLFSTLVQLPTLADLWRTTYGQLLLLKLLLVFVALGLAWFNHRFVRSQSSGKVGADDRIEAVNLPGRFAGEPSPLSAAYRAFARQVWREASVAVGIMIVVALLVQTPPPPPTTPQETSGRTTRFFETILQADDLTIHLQISPNQVGDNRYLTHLYHADGSAIGEVQLVRLTFTHQSAALGQSSLDLTPQGGDFFAASGAYQNRAGPWDVALYVRRRGLDDLLTTTTVDVPPVATTLRNPWQNPIATLPGGVVAGGMVGALLLLPLIGRWVYHRPFKGRYFSR